MKIQQILDLIDSRDMALPEFQRGYVWNRDQVRGFFTSLYRGYPVGGFLVWHTTTGSATQRGGSLEDGKVKLLLDGQQRATTLYGVIRGKAPRFFEGNTQAFTGLHFHLEDEVFEFYAPAKMKDNPAWVDVSDLMATGLAAYIPQAKALGDDRLAEMIARLSRVLTISEKSIHLEDVTGTDKTIDVVVDIFNRVNSGGTKLSKGDLALARVCAAWPEARQTMNQALEEWRKAGFEFSLDWLLRVINAVATGRVSFTALEALSPAEIKTAFQQAQKYVGIWLDVIAGRLGLDHDRVLFQKLALVTLARYVHVNGGRPPGSKEQGKLLYWYVHAGMWGRYAGATETALARDLEAVDTGGVDRLIEIMRLSRGTLTVRPEDFAGNSMGARFYPTLYLLTRTRGARDFDSGVVLSQALLGHLNSLEVHHIFPKKLLYAAGFERGEVNALANFCFLTKNSNLQISASEPRRYLPAVEAKLPGALASQWIPVDRDLWEVRRYTDFLEGRRQLLAEAANEFLSSLVSGELPVGAAGATDHLAPTVTMEDQGDDPRGRTIAELLEFLAEAGFAAPQRDVEVAHPETGHVLSIAEAFWPEGLQRGLTQPVVLELDEESFDENALAALGYLVFTSTSALRAHAEALLGDSEQPPLPVEAASPGASHGSPGSSADSGASSPQVGARDVDDGPDVGLRTRFDRAMLEVYVRAKKEAHYNATAYFTMLTQHGGKETARRLLASPQVSDGFVALWDRGRVDLAVENVVLREEFAPLFTDDERDIARQRLRDYGLDVD